MTTAIITADLADRLMKLCGMFGSDFDGERGNAARMADELVRDAGLTWPDVISGCSAKSKPGHRVWRAPTSVTESAMICLLFAEPHTDWETKFLKSIAGKTTLSRKQWKVLERLVEKSRDFARMEAAA